ncbi:hypothetical protein [Puia sp.]|jgi:threonine/homoserine/homoserine lactone efflux protein|uniref:hypothetical protein n=1 Tax=Puia sp. TaxID=2045100 RepID=UPI002F41CAD3
MNRRKQLFWTVLAISFAGSLPPGILNTGITGLAVKQGVAASLSFGLGAILSEMLVVRIALAGTTSLKTTGPNPRRKWIYLITTGLLLLLAFLHPGGSVAFSRYPFITGTLLSLFNPLHLPFWLGWRAALRSKKLLGNTPPEYNLFSAALGVGTALAFLVYGVAGNLFVRL